MIETPEIVNIFGDSIVFIRGGGVAIHAGNNFIQMGEDGIHIKGTKVKIESDGEIEIAGKPIHIHSSGEVKVEGNPINLN